MFHNQLKTPFSGFKEKSPPGLSGVEPFGGPDILQVLMICLHQERTVDGDPGK